MKKIVVLTMVMLLAGSAWAVIVEDALGAWAFNENTIAEVSGTGAAASLAGGATISGGKVVLRDGQKDGFNFSSVALPFLNQSSFTIYLQDASITRLMAVGMIDYLSWGKTGALCNTTGGRSWIDASNTKLGSWHPVDDSFTEEACVSRDPRLTGARFEGNGDWFITYNHAATPKWTIKQVGGVTITGGKAQVNRTGVSGTAYAGLGFIKDWAGTDRSAGISCTGVAIWNSVLSAADQTAVLDTVVTPEPATLMLLGLGALALIRKRR